MTKSQIKNLRMPTEKIYKIFIIVKYFRVGYLNLYSTHYIYGIDNLISLVNSQPQCLTNFLYWINN